MLVFSPNELTICRVGGWEFLMMKRREFITLLGGAAAWPLAARGQQLVPVIGILAAPAPSPPYAENVSAIRRGLNEAGFVEGRNVAIEFRWAEGQLDRLPALAADLVKRQVAVIITMGGPAPLAAAKNATSTIPIVFHMGADPVRLGFVKSFNRPGGNVTGISLLQVAMAAKRLEVLRELVPAAKIIGLLANPTNPNVETVVPDLHDAAGVLGLQLVLGYASGERDIDVVFESFVRGRVQALLVDADAVLLTRLQQITGLAARHSIPAMYVSRLYVEGGGLMSYGANIADAYREAGGYAGKILKGAHPADLPVTQPTKFELVINLKTAKSLGLTVPQTLLVAADEVIE
jgi:putative ABC transport system substrate-binding protein